MLRIILTDIVETIAVVTIVAAITELILTLIGA